MIRRAGLKKMSTNAGPNMTPMVDIVMCILIFFMLSMEITGADRFLTSNLAAEKGNGIAVTPELKAPMVTSRIVIRMNGKDAEVLAFEQVVKDLKGELSSLLEGKRKDMSADVQILIQPQKDVSYQTVITVYDQCIKARFKNVAFMMP